MNVPFVDIHTHQEGRSPGIIRVLNRIVGLDAINDQLCTVGIHPWHIGPDLGSQWHLLESMLSSPSVIGIGECGLDKRCATDWDLQIAVFERQIRLANDSKRPLIIHSVRAYAEIIQKLDHNRVNTPVVFHGFNKKIDLAKGLLQKGYYLSLGADILRGRQDMLIREIPLSRLFLETDNKTTNIVDIFSYFCAARKVSIVALKKQLAENLEQVFNYSIEA